MVTDMDMDPLIPEPSLEKQLKGHRNCITALSYSPSEQQIASSSLDNSILLWDVSSRGNIKSYRFQGHDEAVMDITFSPSGKYMASASRDKSVRIWVPTVTGSTGMFKAHSQTVRSVQFSPDNSKIITASDDKIVKLWSSDKYKFISSFVGHTNWVRCARISGDGSVIASCSDDKTTRLWNPDSGQLIHTYKDQKGNGLYLAWHPSGCYIAIGTSDGLVKLYDIRTHTLVQHYSIHNDAVTQVSFHPSGSYIITGSKDGKIKILDLLEGSPIFTLNGHTGPVTAVNFAPSGETFATAGEDKVVFIWRTNFTELATDTKENSSQNQSTKTSKPNMASKGIRAWYLCYHTAKYPATTFVHLDDVPQSARNSGRYSTFQEEPRANSTMIDNQRSSNRASTYKHTSHSGSNRNTHNSTMIDNERSSNRASTYKHTSHSGSNRNTHNHSCSNECHTSDCPSNDVGHISHIPRSPPAPATYSIPSFTNKSVGACQGPEEDLFGMIKLKENDVCYTSGTIEWVGRKRSYPINTGFKLLDKYDRDNNEFSKRIKRLDSCDESHKFNECDCADVLPTMNAIVDHLNALHDAVDIVDLRLNTLEDVLAK